MKWFGRGRRNRVPAGAPLSAEDQWFRPDSGSRRQRRAGRAPVAVPASGGHVPAAPDDPTESIELPPDWLDDTTVLPRVGGEAEAPTAATPPITPEPAPVRTKPRRRRRWLRRLAWVTLTVFAAALVAILVVYSRINIPDPNQSALRQTTRVFYANGTEEIGRFGDVNRQAVPLDKVPQSVRDAVLAAENRNFYHDNGVSPTGIVRALWVNLHGGQQGGSTITQQYVKNYYLTPARTWKRKIREALLSIKIDQKLSKDRILEDYLNTIYLGRGAYGVQAAAKAYFQVDVSNLTPSQGIMLAALIRAPARYNPSVKADLDALKARWAYVADAMVQTGKLKPADRAALTFPDIPKQTHDTSRYGGQKGYILTAVRQELLNRGLSEEQIDNGGYRVVTTIDPNAEQAAIAAVGKEFPTTHNKGVRVGLVAIEPGTGRVVAMYGGKDFLGKDKYAQVNAATYPIQPGSTMKVFTTATLLENGYTMDSTFDGDSPLHLPRSKPVRNEFNKSYGSVTLQRALDVSINTAFTQAALKVGPARIRSLMEAAGIPHDTPGLATNARITLGIASIRPLYVADAIATLCGGGIHAEQHIVDKVLGPNGGEVPVTKPALSPQPVIPPGIAYQTIKAMEDVVQHGTGTEAKKLHRPVAGKTGTHQNLTAWFSGCTPQLASSVVYFKGDGTESLDGVGGLRTFFGAVYPAATFTTFMRDALHGKPAQDFAPTKDQSTQAAPATNPYDTSSVDPAAAGPIVNPTQGPQFPAFDTGPSSYTPPPSATPTPSPTARGTAQPAGARRTTRCTDDPTKQTPAVPYDPNCTARGRPAANPSSAAPRPHGLLDGG